MKKKFLYIAAIAICLSIITSGTFAYFTAEDTARNVITTGGAGVSVVEQETIDGELFPYEQKINVMPGTTVSKIVSVKGLEQPVWIRMKYEITISKENNEPFDISKEAVEEMIIIEPDSENWIYKDGWYYYEDYIQNGEKTAPLFEEVVFSGPNMGNEYQNSIVKVIVTAQSVQKANNGNSVMEAKGWPQD